MRKLLFIFLLYSANSHAQTGNVYWLDSNRQVHDLSIHTYILVDSSGNYSQASVLEGKLDTHFVRYASVGSLKNQNYVYWLRFDIASKADIENWLLVLKNNSHQISNNNKLEVFYLDEKRKLISNDKAGAFFRRTEKSVQRTAGFNGLSFSGKTGQVISAYVKISNPFSGSTSFSSPFIQANNIPIPVTNDMLMLRMLNVVSIIFCILSFFFYFFVKDKAYLYFALYTLLLSQHYLILHGDYPFIDLYIPESPQLVSGFWHFLTHGGFICFCLFGREFMNLRSLSPKVDKWFRVYLMIWGGLVIVNTVLLMVFQNTIFPDAIAFMPVLFSFLFFVRFAFFKSILARLFVGGALWLISFTILGVLFNNEIVHLPFNPWPVAQVGQLLIYAAALAYKVRLNERARAEARRISDMDEIKSRFFANISHEFRTPLTLIQGPLQQIEDGASSREGTVPVPLRHIRTMRRNTDRLLELVNQLLDLSKLDSGKMKLQVVKGDVLQLLRVLTASFESIAERKRIHYHVHFPEQTTIVFFDKDKLEKIFSNLLANAFKYTPEQGTVSVIVDVEEERLRFSVEDNGPGIAKKELDKIFDRFYQLEGTEDKGSGIGLALVKELVTLYRGQISVNSEPGKGSRFRVSLPVEKSLFKEDELVYGQWQAEESFINRSIEERDERSLMKASAQSQLPLLLLVEDNTDLRNFIRETLQQHFQVIEAGHGKDGIEKAIAEVPDIIVSDVMMPEMDGFTMTEKLKKDERTSHIPVILLTAKASQGHKLEGLGTGADDYLTKPFDAPELLLRIQNLVNQRKLLRKKFAGQILLRPSEVSGNSSDAIFLEKLMLAIEKNMSQEKFGVEELAREVAMSRSQLHRKLVALTDQSPSEVLRNTRLLRAKELLQKKTATPSEVAYQVGFNSHTYFSKCFKEEFGISPSEVV